MGSHLLSLWADLFSRKKSRQLLTADVLRDTFLFRTLDRYELRYLATLTHERTYQPGEVIFHQVIHYA